MKAYEVTLSGSYKNQEGKLINYNDVKVKIPAQNEQMAEYLARSRYIHVGIRDKVEEKYDIISEYYIDDLKEIDHNFTCIGKLISDLNDVELQDFAAMHDLRSVPLYKNGSIRELQRQAILAFSIANNNFSKKEEIELKQTEFRILKELNIKVTKPEPVDIVMDEKKETALSKLKTMSDNQSESTVKYNSTPVEDSPIQKGGKLEELKYQADALGINYDDDIHFATLQKKVNDVMKSQ